MTLLLLLVVFLLILPILASLTTYSFFWYENGWKKEHSPEGEKLGEMALRGVLSSLASLAFINLTFPLGFVNRNRFKPEPLHPGPVFILTHGLFHNASGWLLFSKHLGKAGYKNVFLMNYGSFSTSFEKTYQKLEKFVLEVSAKAPGRPIYLIGHSLGGLLSRVYAERARGENVPAAVITLGSPHQGAKLAALAPGKLASSLIYHGPLFQRIESEAAGLACPGLALVSPVDNMVMPFDAHLVPYEGWIYSQTSPLSHTGMLYSKSVAQKVIEFVKALESKREKVL
jgi:triacylglycerol esterase/lipase EstA (alpha/beta hydrolase family)